MLGDNGTSGNDAQDLDWDEFGNNDMLGDNGNAAQDLDWNSYGDNGVLGGDYGNDSASFLVSGAAIALTTVLAF